MKSIAENIIAATKALLIIPNRWCQGVSGHIMGDKIMDRCLSRALHDAFMQQGYPTVDVQKAYEQAKDAVCCALPEHHFDIIHFNDDRTTRHSDVMSVLDQAAVTIRQDQARPFDPASQVE